MFEKDDEVKTHGSEREPDPGFSLSITGRETGRAEHQSPPLITPSSKSEIIS